MRKNSLVKLLSRICCIVLVAAIAIFTIGCGDNKNYSSESSIPQGAEVTELGEGDVSFDFAVTYADKKVDRFKIYTDCDTVGAALEELELIGGEVGNYGLMVTTVNGVTVKYEDVGKYWAFYVDGEYAMSGVDQTAITSGSIYEFIVE